MRLGTNGGSKCGPSCSCPEHVHLLIHPLPKKYSISAMLRDIKLPVAKEMMKRIRNDAPATLKLLRNGERSGKPRYSFWQPGRGFDRNLFTPQAIWSSIDYIHANPVRRRLCDNEMDWKYSSACFYAGGDCEVFDVDRCEVLRPMRTKSRRG